MSRKIRFSAIFIVIILFFNISSAFALSIGGKGGFVLDIDTGDQLFAKNADTRYPLASMTKLMTIYIIMDKIKAGKISLNTQMGISKRIHDMSRDWEYTNVVLNEGSYYTVDEIIDAVIIVSACAATTRIVEYISGSEAEFVKLMNQKSNTLGLNAYFADATGIDERNVITPRSMAALASSLIKEYPEILKRTSKLTINFHGVTYKSTNLILGTYKGIDGLKTGTTDAAGQCFTGTAERDGVRLVSVVLGASDRFRDTMQMLDLGFETAEERGEEGSGYAKLFETYPEDESVSEISVFVNGMQIPFYDSDPVLIDGRMFVPARVLASAMSARVVSETDDAAEILSNGERLLISEGVKKGEYLLIPARALTEALGSTIRWEQDKKRLIISNHSN